MTRLMVFLAAMMGASSAFCAPAGLLDKTITMSWSTSGTATSVDGTTKGFSNVNTRIVYVSSAGRTFLRMQLKTAGRGSARSGELGPGETGARGGSVRLEGNRLVGTEAFASGARQYVATFDPGFSSCTLSVIDAKAGGAKIQRRGPNGSMYVLDSASTSSPSCSIQSGNVFAGR
ncbi:MAG: hypothetical protein WAV72_11715 [Bradyrhizobium sp.]